MLLKILTPLAGASFAYSAGQVVEIDDLNATRLVEAGFAIPHRAIEGHETATFTPLITETATLKTTKAKRKAPQPKAVPQ